MIKKEMETTTSTTNKESSRTPGEARRRAWRRSVCAATEVEMKEKKLRVEELRSTRPGRPSKGHPPGRRRGAAARFQALDKIQERDADEKTGIDIIRRAVEAPISRSPGIGVEGADRGGPRSWSRRT